MPRRSLQQTHPAVRLLIPTTTTYAHAHAITVCDWNNEYCTGDVERDDSGIWTCLGNCTARTASTYSPCRCTTEGDNKASGRYPADVQSQDFCVFGHKPLDGLWAQPWDLYYSDWGGGWAQYPWDAAIIPISNKMSFSSNYPAYKYEQYYNNGHKTARSSFLTTNCPPLRFNAWGLLFYSNQEIAGSNTWVQIQHTIHACACLKGTPYWVDRL